MSIALALAMALVLAACGGSDDESADAAETTVVEDSMTEEPMDDSMTEEPMDDSMTEEPMDEHMPTAFTVTISNVSGASEFETPLAPGAFIVHTSMETLFGVGTVDRGEGLEALAEDGSPGALAEELGALASVSTAGTFTTPDDGTEAGPALPGSSYSFRFEAAPGDYLSFATMFVQSNDWFFAPDPNGISLFDGDTPLEGDITQLVGLWDAGTEVDEEPGTGANQAPRQAGPDTGEAQNAPITAVEGYAGTIAVTLKVG